MMLKFIYNFNQNTFQSCLHVHSPLYCLCPQTSCLMKQTLDFNFNGNFCLQAGKLCIMIHEMLLNMNKFST